MAYQRYEAQARRRIFFIYVLDFYALTLKYRLVAGAGFEPTTYQRYEERARGRIFF